VLEASLLADAVHEDNSDMLWPRRGCAHDAGAPTPSFLGPVGVVLRWDFTPRPPNSRCLARL
jgi:hypothetical protein